MNRYVLFFVLISMQAYSTLVSTTSENIGEKKETYEILKKEVSEEFGKRFHLFIMKNLDDQQCNDAMLVKEACNKFLLELFVHLKGVLLGEANISREIKKAPGQCIANFAQNKKEYEYRKNTPWREWSREIEQEAGRKAYEKAFTEYEHGINLSYLFNTSPAKVAKIIRGDRDHIPYEYVFY